MIAIINNIRVLFGYTLIFTLLFGVNICMACYNKIDATSSPPDKMNIVIDAGHGGIDSGCIGKTTKALESDINLSIAKKLGAMLSSLSINIIYTRSNSDGLYGTFASGHKMRDMRAREAIIKKANPNLIISIHLNSYTSAEPKGAQVFYALNSEISKELAQNLQELFAEKIPGSKHESKPGDFYILNCSSAPGILVECGFLSNPEEEAKLIQDSYQEKIAYIIACGIIGYLG